MCPYSTLTIYAPNLAFIFSNTFSFCYKALASDPDSYELLISYVQVLFNSLRLATF